MRVNNHAFEGGFMNSLRALATAVAGVFLIAGSVPAQADQSGTFVWSNPNSIASNLYRSGVVACQIDGFRGGTPAFKDCLRGYLEGRAKQHRDNADRLIEQSPANTGNCLDRKHYRLTRCADA